MIPSFGGAPLFIAVPVALVDDTAGIPARLCFAHNETALCLLEAETLEGSRELRIRLVTPSCWLWNSGTSELCDSHWAPFCPLLLRVGTPLGPASPANGHGQGLHFPGGHGDALEGAGGAGTLALHFNGFLLIHLHMYKTPLCAAQGIIEASEIKGDECYCSTQSAAVFSAPTSTRLVGDDINTVCPLHVSQGFVPGTAAYYDVTQRDSNDAPNRQWENGLL